MTIAEAESFYKLDKEKYILINNQYFLKWYNRQIKNGYSSYLQLNDMQEFIDTIVTWYEIKYPEREFAYYEGTVFSDFKNIKSISNNLNFEQLLFRLPNKQYSIIDCGYRSHGWAYPNQIFMKVDFGDSRKLPYELISANYKTGIVNEMSLLRLNLDRDQKIKLDELLKVLEKSDRNINLKELKDCVNNHNVDLELRKKLLQYVALKLLYSKNTIPERGYERAKRFINEFNKHIPDLKLSTTEIDKLMGTDYKQEYEKQKENVLQKTLKK